MATKKIKVPILEHTSGVTIEVSGFFHMMVQQVLLTLGQSKPEEFKEALIKLKKNDPPSSVYEGEIHVLTILIHSIETAAKEQGKITEREIDVDENYNPPIGTT